MSLVKPEDNPDPNLRTGEDVDEDNCQNSLKKFPRMERETFRAFPQPVCHHPTPPVSLSYSTVLEFVFTFVFIFPFEFVIFVCTSIEFITTPFLSPLHLSLQILLCRS